MKVTHAFVLCCLLVLCQFPVRAEPPQASPAPVLGKQQLTWLEQQDSFRIGLRGDQVPLVFDTGNGVLAGTYIDYLARLSDKLGVTIEPVVLDAGRKSGPVQNDLVTDAVLTTRMPGAPVVPGKRFTDPLMSLTYGLFVSAGDAAIRTLADLEGSRIAVITGDPNQYPMLDPVEKFTPVTVNSVSEAVGRILSGQADAFLAPVPVVSDYLQSAMVNGIGLSVLLDSNPVEVVLRVDTDRDRLYQVLNKAIAAISHNEHRTIRQSWLQADQPAMERNGLELSGSDIDWLKRHPNLKVAFRSDWPPFEYTQDGRPTGLVPDLLTRLETELNVRVTRSVAGSRMDAEEQLRSGKVDILPGLSRTPRTEDAFLFTRAYLTVPIALAIRDDGRFIGDLRELRNERVGVVNRHAAHDYLLINHPN
ncbi:MAG: transporter substrate-binding domain-containing protein, partial [Pseudomonadota bacterium]|nr:transporter substrate-binding domain-containing protein [Pseudomonadota bacterium]